MESRESAAARYRFKIQHARQVERVLQLLGWTVAVLGTLSHIGLGAERLELAAFRAEQG